MSTLGLINEALQWLVLIGLGVAGLALARLPLIAESLASGDLVEVLPQLRQDSPMAYWLIVGPRSAARPEVHSFCDWLQTQASLTRQAIGDVLDPDTLAHTAGGGRRASEDGCLPAQE